MSHSLRRYCAWSVALILAAAACGSLEEDEAASDAKCVPGQSTACVGANSCQGFQLCNDDGSAYGVCNCSNPSNSTGATSSTGTKLSSPIAATGGSRFATSDHFSSFAYGGANPTGTLNGVGGVLAAAGGSVNVAGASARGSTVATGVCAPVDMSSYVYPTYKPARRLGASCSEAEIQNYYDACYSKGNCADFQPNGKSAACGTCLAPSAVDAAEYGPIIRLGGTSSPLDITNMAGCIELMGESDCAKPLMVASLCDYYACASNCSATDSASYQALMTCMTTARSTACTGAQSASVCIRDPAHAAACSGSGFAGQFLAIARAFCAKSP
ncbi:MAG TPA: hypothetical protein VKP30_24220 [Polyangiaceae bacterium]|nr:hypothetical protein [Polyangiaceae bacterium]